jgi:hypothetical protein
VKAERCQLRAAAPARLGDGARRSDLLRNGLANFIAELPLMGGEAKHPIVQQPLPVQCGNAQAHMGGSSIDGDYVAGATSKTIHAGLAAERALHLADLFDIAHSI